MNRRFFYALIVVGSLVELAGCKSLLKKRDPDPAPSAAPVVAPPAVIAPLPTAPAIPDTPPPVAVDETAVPTTEDFEDEAFEKVTPANFRAQFTQLKLEIAKP